MPVCKQCHSRIDKFNKDRCPICGVEHPFEGVSSDTIEITTNINVENVDVNFHPKKKSTLLALFITFGIFGVPFFYIYKKKVGLIYALINVLLLGGLIALLILLTSLNHALVIFLTIFVFVFINFLVGLYFYCKPNLKDGHGVFLV